MPLLLQPPFTPPSPLPHHASQEIDSRPEEPNFDRPLPFSQATPSQPHHPTSPAPHAPQPIPSTSQSPNFPNHPRPQGLHRRHESTANYPRHNPHSPHLTRRRFGRRLPQEMLHRVSSSEYLHLPSFIPRGHLSAVQSRRLARSSSSRQRQGPAGMRDEVIPPYLLDRNVPSPSSSTATAAPHHHLELYALEILPGDILSYGNPVNEGCEVSAVIFREDEGKAVVLNELVEVCWRAREGAVRWIVMEGLERVGVLRAEESAGVDEEGRDEVEGEGRGGDEDEDGEENKEGGSERVAWGRGVKRGVTVGSFRQER